MPPFLALYYATVARGPSLAWLCRASLVLSLLAGLVAVLLMWALYPVHYDYTQAVYQSNFFYSAQRVGKLPLDNSVPWRGDSLTYETGPAVPAACLHAGWRLQFHGRCCVLCCHASSPEMAACNWPLLLLGSDAVCMQLF